MTKQPVCGAPDLEMMLQYPCLDFDDDLIGDGGRSAAGRVSARRWELFNMEPGEPRCSGIVSVVGGRGSATTA